VSITEKMLCSTGPYSFSLSVVRWRYCI
jgi:hypothetical protein